MSEESDTKRQNTHQETPKILEPQRLISERSNPKQKSNSKDAHTWGWIVSSLREEGSACRARGNKNEEILLRETLMNENIEVVVMEMDFRWSSGKWKPKKRKRSRAGVNVRPRQVPPIGVATPRKSARNSLCPEKVTSFGICECSAIPNGYVWLPMNHTMHFLCKGFVNLGVMPGVVVLRSLLVLKSDTNPVLNCEMQSLPLESPRTMDSYPYQINQMPFPHYYHPGIEALPPQMNVDPTKLPFSYDQRCSYAGNYGHPIPPHFCCGHNNFPCQYSYMPSHPHAPSPMYYSGGCPAYSEPYFVPNSPHPRHTMELPRYEYDKYMPRDHHCCGCPNHSCNQKEGKSVKIEEHEPDGGKNVNDALVPIQLKNYPYPVVWIPQDYPSNKQLKNPSTMEVGEQNKPPSLENSDAGVQPAHEPRVWNGWLPFDIKGAPNMIPDGYGVRNQKQESGNCRGESEYGEMDQKIQSEKKRSEFPFPIFWLPYYNKQESEETNDKEKNASPPKIIEEVPHALKYVPVKSYVDECGRNGTGSNQAEHTNRNASNVVEKVTNARSIPVKQIGKDVRPDRMDENETKKDSCTGDKKKQSTFSPKASKLPPVCLRVDPLPRKKKGNGSSRSPSPPSSKGHSQVTSGETIKTPVCGTNDQAQPKLNNQNAPNTSEEVKPKEKTIQVSEYKTNENKGVDRRDGCHGKINVNITSEHPKGTRETCTDGDAYKATDKKAGQGAENMLEENTKLREVKDSSALSDVRSKEGRVLSDADAAILIQAAYRGYQVRKWEPLKKLKQIDEVRKEVINVQDCVQAFERSSGLQNDDKQKIAIGETIMRLLLKLDTLQGLHPSFREIRKSLARELIILQERLDSLAANKPQQQMQDFHVQKDVDVTPTTMQNEEHVQREEEEKVSIPGDSSEGISDDGKVSQSPVDPVPNEGAESVVLPNGSGSEDTSQVGTADTLNSTSDLPETDNMAGFTTQVVTADTLNSTSDLSETDKMAVEPKAKSEVNDSPVEVNELDITVGEELPVGVIDEDINSIEMEEHDNVGSGSLPPAMVNDSALDRLDSENHAVMELPVGLLDEDERKNEMNLSKGERQTENEIFFEELPVGLLDENPEKSEVEANRKTYAVVPPAQEERCNADEKTTSTDDPSKETQLEQQQQQMENQDEVQSSGESDGWVKVEFNKEDELKGDLPVDIGIETQSGEFGIGTELPPLTTQVNDHEAGSKDVCLEANDVNISPQPKEFVPVNDTQKEEEPEGKIALKEIQDDQEIVAEILAHEKTEPSVASPALPELEIPAAEHDGRLKSDSKLVEENEKLRKMMEKLLEAGNAQLSVISDLTGRVKDLEKRLARTKARSKRVKTKRHRPATSNFLA
ncbi:unnamed protein product [Sphenostylis stenocarpa]|uniref:BAG domain-containing protein n=1 Tax=Sphenostylis stenocarpa TaxID=92480 RepID=A0AA86SB04_9FABA|nr:unnamed protein product [Sphenostylis stenocarpa]